MDPLLPVDHQHEPCGFARWSEILIAIGCLVLGAVILWGVREIRTGPSTTVGPRIFPIMIGWGLVAASVWYAIDIVRVPHANPGGDDAEDVDADAETDWRTLIILGIALTAFAALVRPAGFPLASGALFTIASFGMGERRWWISLIMGVILGTLIWMIFDLWLGVRLPLGFLESVLR